MSHGRATKVPEAKLKTNARNRRRARRRVLQRERRRGR